MIFAPAQKNAELPSSQRENGLVDRDRAAGLHKVASHHLLHHPMPNLISNRSDIGKRSSVPSRKGGRQRDQRGGVGAQIARPQGCLYRDKRHLTLRPAPFGADK